MVGAAPIEILRLNSASALDVGNVRRALVAVLVLAALSMGLAVAADQVVWADLDAQKSDVLRRVGEHRTAMRRDGVSGALSGQLALERRKRETPSSVIMLEALSQILPDHTYATELRVEGDKLQVVGITHDAPSLIRLIEQSLQFTRATFFAPTTRSPNDPGERFHIEARIKLDLRCKDERAKPGATYDPALTTGAAIADVALVRRSLREPEHVWYSRSAR